MELVLTTSGRRIGISIDHLREKVGISIDHLREKD